MSAEVTAGCGDVGRAGLRSRLIARLRRVATTAAPDRDVADPMKSVLDAPVSAQRVG